VEFSIDIGSVHIDTKISTNSGFWYRWNTNFFLCGRNVCFSVYLNI